MASGSEEEQNPNVPEQIKTFNINCITVLKVDKCHCKISANSGIILLHQTILLIIIII